MEQTVEVGIKDREEGERVISCFERLVNVWNSKANEVGMRQVEMVGSRIKGNSVRLVFENAPGSMGSEEAAYEFVVVAVRALEHECSYRAAAEIKIVDEVVSESALSKPQLPADMPSESEITWRLVVLTVVFWSLAIVGAVTVARWLFRLVF